jgi:large subunit ribosomal protein L17
MRHGIAGYKLTRDTEHRRAMYRNLASAVIQHGQITTTKPKAKAVQPFVEKLVTLAKRGDLHARRQAVSALQDREQVFVRNGGQDPDNDIEVAEQTVIQKLFAEIGPRYKDRTGGYTRIIKLANHRIGDGGDLVILQLVGDADSRPKPKASSRRRKIADARTAYAGKLRKGEKAKVVEQVKDEPAADKPAE